MCKSGRVLPVLNMPRAPHVFDSRSVTEHQSGVPQSGQRSHPGVPGLCILMPRPPTLWSWAGLLCPFHSHGVPCAQDSAWCTQGFGKCSLVEFKGLSVAESQSLRLE